ncbi:tRNA lysidine(34) synthetase TilS [Aliikangiella sp. G2MR2-5]|uniref:tRNA lysidine(34) synthetase TilS n=1 Tax=Aliikangiella sp. G2MR2-5 TaxID=2788943 RepID=UPI001AED1ACB|nr:tRNA lysidine(34) synthetase TilS [Aliikangiella sp. G2MR2-5]
MSDYQSLNHLEQVLADFLVVEFFNHCPDGVVKVALSGGVDSKALLFACAQLRDRGYIQKIQALHVDHGLQKDSISWLEKCVQDCNELDVEIKTICLNLGRDISSNIEAVAREKRYQFFETELEENECLLFAHHQNDQAETLMFRLLRGCGLSGAGAMPIKRRLGLGRLFRPWLNESRAAIEEYASERKLCFISDPSNFSTCYSRNYLRHQVMPRLEERWPSYARSFSRFTQLAREQAELLAELAKSDIEKLVIPPKNREPQAYSLSAKALTSGVIAIGPMLELKQNRVKNLLHYWGSEVSATPPTSNEIQELMVQLSAATTSSICVSFAGGKARSFDSRLYWTPKELPNQSFKDVLWNNLKETVELDNGVTLSANQKKARDSSDVLLKLDVMERKVWLTARKGGEKVVPHYRKHSNSLKKIYQELAVPPWEREYYPLIYVDDELAAVPGIFVSQKFLAKPGEEGIALHLGIASNV